MLGEMGEAESVMARFFGGSSLESHSGPRCQWFGNGSFASSITKPSITCVSTLGLIIAFGRPPLSVVPVLLWGGRPVLPPPPVPVLVAVGVVVGAWGFVGVAPATDVAVLVGGVDVAVVAESNPLALTAVTGVGAAAEVAVVTGATLVTGVEAGAEAAFAMLVVVDAESELLVVVENEALVVVDVCGAVVVVLTAPAGSSDEATAGGCPADGVDALVVAVGVGVMDTDAAGDAVAACCVGVAAAVLVVVVVKGAGDEVSIGVGPFNCASDALSAAAAVF